MIDIREELHEALDDQYFSSPALLARAMSRLDPPGRANSQRWVQVFAIVLAIAIVVMLVTVRVTLGGLHNLSSSTATPNDRTLPVSSNVTGVTSYQFVSPGVGWLNVSDGSRTVIAKTTDGGRTWHSQLTMTGSFSLSPRPMRFFDEKEGLVVGQNGRSPTAWRTSDGGSTWQMNALPSDGQEQVVSISFLDGMQGWVLTTAHVARPAVSDRAYVYHTTDGGIRWARLGTIDPVEGIAWTGIRFVSPTTGLVTVSVGSSPWRAWAAPLPLFATRDGGATWTKLNLTAPPPGAFIEVVISFFGETGVLVVEANSVQPCPSQSGCIAVIPAGRYLYSTADGGRTWSVPRPIGHGYVALADAQHWFLLNSDSYTVSSDGGKTFSAPRALSVPPHWFATEAQFLDAERGWITLSDTSEGNFQGAGAAPPSGRSALIYTRDGGSTWQSVALPATLSPPPP